MGWTSTHFPLRFAKRDGCVPRQIGKLKGQQPFGIEVSDHDLVGKNWLPFCRASWFHLDHANPSSLVLLRATRGLRDARD